MKVLKNSLLAFFCLTLIIGCGDGTASKATKQVNVKEVFPEDIFNTVDSLGRANLTESQQALMKYVKEANQATALPEVVTAASLLALYPVSIDGLSKFDEGGEISDGLGANATLTRIIYRDGNEIARVNLIDTGGHPGVLLGTAHWILRAQDKQTANVVERTQTFRGFPAYEQWLPKSMQSKFEYVIDNRFVVSIQGKNLTMERVRKIAEFLSPAQLRETAKG